MKLWLSTTKNKCFVKMLSHLLGEYVKTTVLLVCSICIVHHFFYFFPVIDLCFFFYRIFALFIQRFSLFIYNSILASHFVLFFFFFSVFCLYFFFPFIYITVHPVFLHCERTIAAIVLWFHESFFLFFFFSFFFSFKYWCKLTFILLYWHNKFHSIFIIINVSISYKSK